MESMVTGLAGGQVEAGHEVTVVCVFPHEPEDHPFWDGIANMEGVRAVPVVLPGRRYLDEKRFVRTILREYGAEVLHTHGYRPDVLLASEARRAGVSVVTTVHGFSGGGVKNRIYEWLQRRAHRSFDGVVAVSADLRRELAASGVPESVLWCIPNAWRPSASPAPRLDARRQLRLPEDGPVIGWVGRMSGVKAPDIMAEAFARIEHRAALLSFVGDGPLLASLGQRVGAAAASRVRLHGAVPGASRLLSAFDVLAITSWSEGTPMILLEAMAAGVPVVTTAVGGIPDVVSDREAVLVRPGDVEGIARAFDSVLADPDGARERALAARARLGAEFATEPWVRRYDEIYRGCLEPELRGATHDVHVQQVV
jgi:glycosyltransferase involved in cell wall biosynthesis